MSERLQLHFTCINCCPWTLQQHSEKTELEALVDFINTG
uniref:Uncharacterized protein n=1 Tax=Anguilla anguilla TaxID=7936 RepID=A0A0E9TBC4_ANGAN